jgi:hypothetical protein
MALILRCKCGQRIEIEDLVQISYYPRSLGPNMVHLRYQCPRCARVGEQLIRQQEWDKLFLDASPSGEFSLEERQQFAHLEPITEEEVVQFRERLESVNPLQSLRDWLRKEKKT